MFSSNLSAIRRATGLTSVSLLAAVLISACSGGGGGSAPTIPAAATPTPMATSTTIASGSSSAAPSNSPSPTASGIQVKPSPIDTSSPSETLGTSTGIGWDSATFNHGNGVYLRNLKGTASAACNNPLPDTEIAFNMLLMTLFDGKSLSVPSYDKALWNTKRFDQESIKRRIASDLPQPTEWIPFDVYSGSFKITNGGNQVSNLDQCFIVYVRHDHRVFDTTTLANSNALGGYNDPISANNKGQFRDHFGKFKSLTIPNFTSNGGKGSFTLDNGWNGEIVLTSFATIEVGGYFPGIDAVADANK